MLAGWPDGVGRGRPVRRRSILPLQQRARRQFAVEPHDQLRSISQPQRAREQHFDALLAILLDRLAEQEVLEEFHARAAQRHAQVQLVLVAEWAVVVGGCAQAARLPVGLRVGIRARDGFVLVGVLTDDEPGRVLVEVGRVQPQRQLAGTERLDEARRQLLLVEARILAPATVMGQVHGEPGRAGPGRARQDKLSAQVVVAAGLEAQADGRQVGRRGVQDVDDAVDRVRSVQGAARASQDLDCGRLLKIGLEQLVDVAEADRPQRYAVFQEQEGAAGTRAGQDRRAQGGQRFLAAAALDEGARRTVEQLGMVGRTGRGDFGRAQSRDAPGVGQQGLLLA